jgi:hypothetical protein
MLPNKLIGGKTCSKSQFLLHQNTMQLTWELPSSRLVGRSEFVKGVQIENNFRVKIH